MINSRKKSARILSLLLAAALSLATFTMPVLAEDGGNGVGAFGDAGDAAVKAVGGAVGEAAVGAAGDAAGDADDDAGVGPVTLYLKSLEAAGAGEDEGYDDEDYGDEEGLHVHADPETFEKNFCLSVAQKQYAITEIDRMVSKLLKPEMSDLEKYYTLAVWENKRCKYDWHFWSGSYHFDLYRHQWDSYGVLTEKSVCAGIAITYAALCHAADLPCKFARTDPQLLDHTVNYIPDINGNAYSVDVTENSLFMSENAGSYFEMDKEFSQITKDCTDGSFEYHKVYDDYYTEDGEPIVSVKATNIKDCYKISYDDWFREYALHEDTDKDFRTPYVEKGSGLPATDPDSYHASYSDFEKYPAQPYGSRSFDSSEVTGIWFLDDFYTHPIEARDKILGKEFDEQFLNISGVKESYDCEAVNELEDIVKDDLAIQYFPSVKNGEIVAVPDDLKAGTDYKLEYVAYDASTGEAVFDIIGIGGYTGTQHLRVKLNDIEAADVELSQSSYTYNGKVQKPSIVSVKGMFLNEGTDYKATWSNENSRDAGSYSVTIEGKGIYSGTTGATYVIKKAANPMTLKAKTAKVKFKKLKKKDQTVKLAKVITLSGAEGGLSCKLVSAKKGGKSFKKYFKINGKTGNVTVKKGLKKGTYKVTAQVGAAGNANYEASGPKKVTFKIKVK